MTLLTLHLPVSLSAAGVLGLLLIALAALSAALK